MTRGLVVSLASLAVACGSTRPAPAPVSARDVGTSLNERIAAARTRTANAATDDYRIGPGDVLEIDVFQADELDRTVRVRPDGSISLPLLGVIPVAKTTTARLEQELAQRLGRDYLQEPRVSVFVKEYQAHPVSVLGEVNDPGVYFLRGPRTLLSMLSESGGLTPDASSTVHLRRLEGGEAGGSLALVKVDLDSLLDDSQRDLDLVLQDEDTIYVPKAGVVFVEGSVGKPGAYPLHKATTVLKALAMASGLEFEAKKSGVQVVRRDGPTPEVLTVDIGAVRRDPSRDVPVRDGDVVIVGSDPVKLALVGIWRGVAGLVRVSTGF